MAVDIGLGGCVAVRLRLQVSQCETDCWSEEGGCVGLLLTDTGPWVEF